MFFLEDWIVLEVTPEEIPETLKHLWGLGYRTTVFYLDERFVSQRRFLEHVRDNVRRPKFIQSKGAWSYIS